MTDDELRKFRFLAFLRGLIRLALTTLPEDAGADDLADRLADRVRLLLSDEASDEHIDYASAEQKELLDVARDVWSDLSSLAELQGWDHIFDCILVDWVAEQGMRQLAEMLREQP